MSDPIEIFLQISMITILTTWIILEIFIYKFKMNIYLLAFFCFVSVVMSLSLVSPAINEKGHESFLNNIIAVFAIGYFFLSMPLSLYFRRRSNSNLVK